LPKKLLLQMNNYMKDNKNQHFLAILSLFIVKDVFNEVKLKFLVVGHTHENIDGCFGYLSKMLKEQQNYILANLMKAFIVL
jgi:CO dehydrogenase nickel-insertion accessory protein CooC1